MQPDNTASSLFSEMLDSIFRVARKTASTSDIDVFLSRRRLKLLEELGEVSQAYLDVTGNNLKHKTVDDVLEEQVDTFIVAADLLIQVGLTMPDVAEQLPELKAAMQKHLCRIQAEPPGADFQQRIFDVALQLSALALTDNPYLQAIRLYEKACYLLIQDIKGRSALQDTQTQAEQAAARLIRRAEMVSTKVEKWERNLKLAA